MENGWVPRIDREDKTQAIRTLLESTTQGIDYYLLLTLSVIIATIGIAYHNIPLLIASMLIAPILYPILALSLGIVLHDVRVIGLSAQTLTWSGVGAVLLALFSSIFVGEPSAQLRADIAELFTPSVGYLVVAVAAGIAVTYTLVRPHLSEHLSGVAVAVALLPPLAATGAAVAWGWWEVAVGALALFGLNIGGIVAASVVVFSLFDMRAERPAAQAALAARESTSGEAASDHATESTPAGAAGGPPPREEEE